MGVVNNELSLWQVRRRAIAALGELMFYVASQVLPSLELRDAKVYEP